MKKYMFVYNFTLSDGEKRTAAHFADTEKEVDSAVEQLQAVYEEDPEVYIYTIYGYHLLYR